MFKAYRKMGFRHSKAPAHLVVWPAVCAFALVYFCLDSVVLDSLETPVRVALGIVAIGGLGVMFQQVVFAPLQGMQYRNWLHKKYGPKTAATVVRLYSCNRSDELDIEAIAEERGELNHPQRD